MTSKTPGRLRSLKGDRAFARLRRGRPGGARYLSLRWRATNFEEVRVGIVVSKKVGKAVVRNRVRRRIREGLREVLSNGTFASSAIRSGVPSFDAVIIARPDAADADYATLKDALVTALKRGKVLA